MCAMEAELCGFKRSTLFPEGSLLPVCESRRELLALSAVSLFCHHRLWPSGTVIPVKKLSPVSCLGRVFGHSKRQVVSVTG